MSKIAILINCRVQGNKNCGIIRLLDTLAQKTTNYKDIEAHIKFDTCDPEAGEMIQKIKDCMFPFPVKTIVEPRGRGYIDIHHGYNRLLIGISPDAELIGAMGDDFIVMQGWDVALVKAYKQNGKGMMIIHQRPHPPTEREDYDSRPFAPEYPMIDKMEDLYIVDEAPFWSRELVYATTWLGGGLSFTDGWTIALEHLLWENHKIRITQFTDARYIDRIVHPTIDTEKSDRWTGDRATNFEYVRSSYFREIVSNQAKNIALRLKWDKTGNATFAGVSQNTQTEEIRCASITGQNTWEDSAMEKKFSIIFPTRERPELLSNIIASIYRNTRSMADVEVLIAYDDDDKITQEFVDNITVPFVKWFKRPRSKNFSRDYYNFLFTQSKGKWIIVCNDDAEFRTPGWDTIAEKTINEYIGDRPQVFLGWIEDGLGEARHVELADYCCFPLLGRAGVEAIGYIFPEDIGTWGADIWARKLYNTIERVVVIPIVIFHLNHWNGTRPQDHINKQIQANYKHGRLDPTRGEIRAMREAVGLPDA